MVRKGGNSSSWHALGGHETLGGGETGGIRLQGNQQEGAAAGRVQENLTAEREYCPHLLAAEVCAGTRATVERLPSLRHSLQSVGAPPGVCSCSVSSRPCGKSQGPSSGEIAFSAGWPLCGPLFTLGNGHVLPFPEVKACTPSPPHSHFPPPPAGRAGRLATSDTAAPCNQPCNQP